MPESRALKVDSIQQKQPAETECPVKSNNPALYNNGRITSPDDIIPLNKRTAFNFPFHHWFPHRRALASSETSLTVYQTVGLKAVQILSRLLFSTPKLDPACSSHLLLTHPTGFYCRHHYNTFPYYTSASLCFIVPQYMIPPHINWPREKRKLS
jgi:hypothetical protein